MPIRYPPRREPRVLAVDLADKGLAFVSVDPWMIRSAGRTSCRPRSRSDALSRLIRREKPTAVATPSVALAPSVRRAARRLELPVVEGPLPALLPSVAADLYPELPVLAPDPALARLSAFAISAVLNARVPSRTYVTPRRHHAAPRPAR
jgi:hypothetical protein